MSLIWDSDDDLCFDDYELGKRDDSIAECDGCGSPSPLSMIEVTDDSVGYSECVFLCERCMEKRAR